MAGVRRSLFSRIFTGCLLTAVIFTELLLAVPLSQLSREHDTEKISAELSPKRIIRNRRNISWYKQHSDFWNWYKFFTDSGNQQGVADLDRMYLAYLQNKNRAESQRSYKLYLQHLGEIYKSCAETDDPNCVATYLSRSKPKAEPQRPAPVKSCDPYRDPQCLYALGYSAYPYVASVKSSAPAPVKTPAYIRTPVVKNPSPGQYYHAPLAQTFLSPEQKAELLRICGAEDVECLQYHFRGAYGNKPAGVPAPSYAHLGSSSQKVQKAPASLHRRYPNCDPRYDPYCAYGAAAAPQKSEAPSSPAAYERFCNPLYEENCNPLTATRYEGVASQSEDPKDDPAPVAAPVKEFQNPYYDPYAMFQDAAAAASALHRLSPGSRQIPQHLQPPTMEENPQSLGPPGKTKDGYDCFIGYDKECYPTGTQNVPNTVPQRQLPHSMNSYEPHLNADGTRKGVIEPDPHCDPEYDRNCRLRRYEPEADEPEMQMSHNEEAEYQERREEPARHEEQREEVHPEPQPDNQGYEQQQQYDRYMSGQEDPYASYDQPNQGPINFQDILKAYANRFPNQEHQRAYKGDYKKK